MKKREISYSILILLIFLSIIIYYFIGVRYEISLISRLLISFFSFLVFFYSYKRGLYNLILAILTGFSIFISLNISFGKIALTDSPISLGLVLGPWNTFFLSFISCLVILFLYERMKSPDKFANLLFLLFLFVWLILAFNPLYFSAWKMENWLTVPFILILIIIHKWFKLSNLSYTMLFLFMVLHIIGSHYTYSEVPFGFWLQSFLGLTRNHYDRIVHFAFGLLFAYPIREISKRISNIKGIWAIWIPIELILALSCIYELLEWGVAVIFGGDLGIAYLGSQGDIWDAQKDMALAGFGALITMIFTSITIVYYNSKLFWNEIKESFSIKQKEPLGERALVKLMLNKKV